MPQINETQKAIIRTRLHDGVSIRAIAHEVGVNKNTIVLAKKKIIETGVIGRKQGTGRRRVTTQQQDNQLVNYLRENPYQTAIRAKEETEFPGSSDTAWRRIRDTEIRSRCAANKIFLTEENKQQRLQFAQDLIRQADDFWDNVVFSDEKCFQSCHNGTVRVYRPRGERYNPQYTRKTNKSGRFSVNVWAWISRRGRGVCVVLEERLTAIVYRRVLEEALLPSVQPIFGENVYFQHDNSPVHRARTVQNFIEERGINVLPWASKSPDINPIENVWGQMVKTIYQEGFRPRNSQELRQRIIEAWQQITPEYTDRLVSSIPRRLQNVINNNGDMTKY